MIRKSPLPRSSTVPCFLSRYDLRLMTSQQDMEVSPAPSPSPASSLASSSSSSPSLAVPSHSAATSSSASSTAPVASTPTPSLHCRISIDSANFARFSAHQFPIVCATVSVVDEPSQFLRRFSDIITRPLPLLIATERDTLQHVRPLYHRLRDLQLQLQAPFVVQVCCPSHNTIMGFRRFHCFPTHTNFIMGCCVAA
jgi:hypothetical protein